MIFLGDLERSVSFLRSEMDNMLELLQEMKRNTQNGNLTFDKINDVELDFESKLPFRTLEDFLGLEDFLLEDKNRDTVVIPLGPTSLIFNIATLIILYFSYEVIENGLDGFNRQMKFTNLLSCTNFK